MNRLFVCSEDDLTQFRIKFNKLVQTYVYDYPLFANEYEHMQRAVEVWTNKLDEYKLTMDHITTIYKLKALESLSPDDFHYFVHQVLFQLSLVYDKLSDRLKYSVDATFRDCKAA